MRAGSTPISRDVRLRAALSGSVLCAYSTAGLADPWFPPLAALFVGGAIWSLLFEGRRRNLLLSPAAKIGIVVAGALVFGFLYGRDVADSSRKFSESITRFLLWNAAVFTVSRQKTEHDLWTLAIIDLSLFMIAGAFVQATWFVPFFLGGIVCLLYVFLRLSLLRGGQSASGGFGVSFVHLAASLGVAAALFLVIPRSGSPRMGSEVARSPERKRAHDATRDTPPVPSGRETRTGIPPPSGSLSLTNLAEIKKDATPVLRGRFLRGGGNPPSDRLRYLRGIIYDAYSQGRWSSEPAWGRLRADRSGWIRLREGAAPLILQIRTEPAGGRTLFFVGEPRRIRQREILYDARGMAKGTSSPLAYEAASRIPGIPAAGAPHPASDPRYLRIPPELGELRRIVRERTRGTEHAVDRIRALVRYLRGGEFSYALSPFVAVDGMDPVLSFLTRRKRGYCVHFASALALLCRAGGIPARLAVGFVVERMRAPPEEFEARNSDAHAWVEVDFGPAGWVPFDPTPPDLVASSESSTAPEWAPPIEDEAWALAGKDSRWDTLLTDYDGDRQQGVVDRIGRSAAAIVRDGGRALSSPWFLGPLLALVVAAMCAFLVLPSSRRIRVRRILARFRTTTPVPFYKDFLWILAQKGFRKRDGQTAREFARCVALRWQDPGIARITDLYGKARFGGARLSRSERREIGTVLDRLRTAPRES